MKGKESNFIRWSVPFADVGNDEKLLLINQALEEYNTAYKGGQHSKNHLTSIIDAVIVTLPLFL